MPDRNFEATVVNEPVSRSYQVNTPNGTYRKNCRDLIQIPKHSDDGNTTTDQADLKAASNSAVKILRASDSPRSKLDIEQTQKGRCIVSYIVHVG